MLNTASVYISKKLTFTLLNTPNVVYFGVANSVAINLVFELCDYIRAVVEQLEI